jgi:hypothetical protein
MPGTQLDLFADRGPVEVAGGPWPAAAPSSGQLSLIDARAVKLAAAREALARGRLDEATHDYAELLRRAPEDAALALEAARAGEVRQQLAAAATAPAEQRPRRLLAVAEALASASGPAPAALRRALLREAASLAAASAGDEEPLAGELPGFYLLAAGADAAALASLTRALARRRTARALYLLADASFTVRGAHAARPLYFEALLLDPFDVALRAARCEAVRGLPEVAATEYGIADEPAAWSAAVGVLTDVLPPPAELAPDLRPTARERLPEASEHARGCLIRCRRFVEAMLAERALDFVRDEAEVLALRRTMRQLAPALFTAWMRRRGGRG